MVNHAECAACGQHCTGPEGPVWSLRRHYEDAHGGIPPPTVQDWPVPYRLTIPLTYHGKVAATFDRPPTSIDITIGDSK